MDSNNKVESGKTEEGNISAESANPAKNANPEENANPAGGADIEENTSAVVSTNKMEALFIIINAGHAEKLVNLLREAGARGATILNSRGEGTRHQSFMGITMDSEKEMIVCVVEKETAQRAMKLIKEKMGVQTPARSVSFTMPVDTLVGIDMSAENAANGEN